MTELMEARASELMGLLGRQVIDDGVVARVVSVDVADGGMVCLSRDPGRMRPASEVVVLPRPGERFTVAGESSVWLGLAQPAGPVKGAAEVVSVRESGTVAFHSEQLDVLDVRRSVSAWLTQDDPLAVVLAGEALGRRDERMAAVRWRQSLEADAHEWADDNDLCERFDEFMVNHGLEGRRREFRFRVEATATVYITATGRSEEDARENITTSEVVDEITVHNTSWEAEED